MLASRFFILMRIAIIIPTLDEESAISNCLASALESADEVIVTDGGSSDQTCRLAQQAGVKVVVGSSGRGPQLNRGATAANSEILLFLHADTQLPDAAPQLIRQAVRGGANGGSFLIRFDSSQHRFQWAARLINWRTHLTRLPLGDQAQFVSRKVFEDLEGFRDWPILEDLDFSRRLKKLGPTVILEEPVTTSARRYQRGGLLRTTARNWLIWLLFLLGVSPTRLGRLYRKTR